MSGPAREFEHAGERLRVGLRALDGGRFAVQVGDQSHEVDARVQPDGRVRFVLDGVVYLADAARSAGGLQVRLGTAGGVDARTWTLKPAAGRGAAGGAAQTGVVETPMTGTILDVAVQVGDAVEAGQTIVVLTAMKMEHKLTTGIAGVVRELHAEVGATVDQGVVVARVEPAE